MSSLSTGREERTTYEVNVLEREDALMTAEEIQEYTAEVRQAKKEELQPLFAFAPSVPKLHQNIHFNSCSTFLSYSIKHNRFSSP